MNLTSEGAGSRPRVQARVAERLAWHMLRQTPTGGIPAGRAAPDLHRTDAARPVAPSSNDKSPSVRQPARQQLGRRDAGEGAEVAREVGLIVVAAVGGDIGEVAAGRARQPIGRLSEPQHAREDFRGQPNLFGELANEMAMAPAGFLGQRADRELTVTSGRVD